MIYHQSCIIWQNCLRLGSVRDHLHNSVIPSAWQTRLHPFRTVRTPATCKRTKLTSNPRNGMYCLLAKECATCCARRNKSMLKLSWGWETNEEEWFDKYWFAALHTLNTARGQNLSRLSPCAVRWEDNHSILNEPISFRSFSLSVSTVSTFSNYQPF